jgi:hypothetical protein
MEVAGARGLSSWLSDSCRSRREPPSHPALLLGPNKGKSRIYLAPRDPAVNLASHLLPSSGAPTLLRKVTAKNMRREGGGPPAPTQRLSAGPPKATGAPSFSQGSPTSPSASSRRWLHFLSPRWPPRPQR